MPESTEPTHGRRQLFPDRLQRVVGWCSALLLGVALALAFGPLSEPFWDGRARSLMPVWVMVAVFALGATAIVVVLSGPWSIMRYVAHVGLVALGFGLFFLVILVMIMTYTPSCPDPAAIWAFEAQMGSLAPQSCPG